MKCWKKVIKHGLICLLGLSARAADMERLYEVQVEPEAGENFSYAYVQCWLPPSAPQLKGILCVILHPHEHRTVRFADPRPWIELAAQYDCAVMGVSFVEKDGDLVPWSHAAKGSGRALTVAINELAEKSRTPGLGRVPLIVAGICEAGQFAHEFTAREPERVRAFFTMGGGRHDLALAQAAAGVPGLLIAGPDRGHNALNNMFNLFAEGRRHHAPWIFAAEPITEYDRGSSSALTVSFLELFLKRLNSSADETATISVPLRQVVFSVGQYPKSIEPVLAKINASDLSGIFYDQSVAAEWQRQSLEPGQHNLSFVSQPLPPIGSVTPPTVSMGRINVETTPQNCQAEFEVLCADGVQADDIKLLANPNELTYQTKKLTDNKWQVVCQLNPQAFPSGVFKLEVPIRIVGKQSVYGGLSCLLTGRIVSDISATPAALNVGMLSRAGKELRLRLKSASRTRIEIQEIQSSFPNWVRVEVKTSQDADVELLCKFAYPTDLKNESFGGYLNIKAKSKYGQLIKVLFYGSVERDGK
jgi:hypothetical protein